MLEPRALIWHFLFNLILPWASLVSVCSPMAWERGYPKYVTITVWSLTLKWVWSTLMSMIMYTSFHHAFHHSWLSNYSMAWPHVIQVVLICPNLSLWHLWHCVWLWHSFLSSLSTSPPPPPPTDSVLRLLLKHYLILHFHSCSCVCMHSMTWGPTPSLKDVVLLSN